VVREPGLFAIFIISWFLSILVIEYREAWDFWNILIIRGQSFGVFVNVFYSISCHEWKAANW
jgi:hypothetical protein